MAEEEKEKHQKTEEPTQKRIDDAVKKGQVVTSREVNSFFMLLAFTILIIVLAPPIMDEMRYRLSHYIIKPHDIDITDQAFYLEMHDLMYDVLVMMVLPIILAISAVFLANAAQNRFVLSTEPIVPKLSKISIIKGFGRLFSRRSMVEFVKGLVKITVVGAVAMIAIWPYKEHLRLLPDENMFELLTFISSIAGRMMIGICMIMLIIALLDFAYQKFEYLQNLKMTKQELKDEFKQQEGDPQVKQKLKQIRRERAKKRMMEAVPQADVVITNPEHYAVALQYDQLTMNAPHVVAKGTDKAALRIKEVAEQHKITVMRNPPLARLLYDNARMDEEIPYEYYKAVAEIIGYVYKLRGINPQQQKKAPA